MSRRNYFFVFAFMSFQLVLRPVEVLNSATGQRANDPIISYNRFHVKSFFCLVLEACRLELEAWPLFFIFIWRFKIICNMVLGYFSPEPLHRAAVQPVMKLVAHWWWFHSHVTINKNATCTRISATIQNVNPIIFLSVLVTWPQIQLLRVGLECSQLDQGSRA